MKSNRFLALAAITAAALSSPAALAADLTNVSIIQMHPAIGVGEEVFMYAVPKRLGFFKEEGLEVAIQGVAGGGPAAQVLQSGGAEFGTTMPESILQVREQGGDLVAFYSLKRNNGTILITPEASSIRELKDLKGKTVGGMSFGSGGGLALKNNLAVIGLQPDQYSLVTTGVGPSALTAMQLGQIDAVVLWDAMRGAAENTGMALRAVEIPIQNDFAAMTLATTERFAKANPQVVKGMCRAVAKGLRFALTNPEAAIKIFWEEFPTTKPANVDADVALRNQVHILTRWFEMAEQGVEPGKETGAFLTGNWEKTLSFYKEAGLLKGSKAAAEGYTQAYLDDCNRYDRGAVESLAKASK